MTSFHPLSYNTDRNQDTGRGRQRMDKDKIEHLLKKYSFWEHLSEKEREILTKKVSLSLTPEEIALGSFWYVKES